ncbi:MAG TPA: ParB/RepB/Spo0J family partition protein [Verrucomicrobiae bacterium]|jgi:ParB family chromosome partitioning protein|nr:ParB/RepB/Spo0J family partition protein [Verrucomicrobiae bacterium]
MTRKVLGRGLDALISGDTAAVATEGLPPQGGTMELSIELISPNPFQPRKRFDDTTLRELADSIKAAGVLQPLLVRRVSPGDYQLVAGERRLRAAQMVGLKKVPVVVKDVDDRAMMEMALVENIQREALDPIEEARAYQTLIEKVGLTHEKLSERVGKQRVTITNSLRLLSLPAEVIDMVSRGTLSAGHARALLALENRGDLLAAARYVATKGFSVRRTESFVRRKQRTAHARPRAARLAGLPEWETKLQQRFSTQVAIHAGRKGGKVEFEFYSQDDLERLLEAWGVL